MSKIFQLFSFLCISLYFQPLLTQDYHVKNFNATGDGKADDTNAVRAAVAAAANSQGGRVIFDAGYTFLTGAFNISSNFILDVRGTILGSNLTDHYLVTNPNGDYDPLIAISNAKNVTITGGGLIDGQGAMWWPCAKETKLPPCNNKHRPRILNIRDTTDIIINNVVLKNSPNENIALQSTKNVHIYNISILAPSSHDPVQPSHNTDAIDVNGQNIVIENSYISVGDDAIAIGGSSGLSQNITVQNLTIGTSHGISIGSYTSGGVQNVIFQHISMNGSDSGPRIKSQRGRGGLVHNITYTNIQLYNMDNCIGLTMNYSKTYTPPTNDSITPKFKNITINNLTCHTANQGWWLEGLDDSAIEASFSNIQITNAKKMFAECTEIYGSCDNSSVKPSCPPCMQIASCIDASSDCAQYLSFCNNPTYHTMLCDKCQKTCNLCNSCN